MCGEAARERGGRAEGFSMLELMIAALLFIVITASVYVLFTRSQKTFVSQQQLVAAQQNARAAMDYITENISLAGYGVPTPQVYTTVAQADPTIPLPTSDVNTSAFADFDTFSTTTAPVDGTHLFLKGCFSKTFGSVTLGLLIPYGSATFPATSATLNVSPVSGNFSVGDRIMFYDINPGGVIPFFWVYGTVSSITSVTTSPPVIALGVSLTDGTIPGTSPFGGYTITSGAAIYKVETRAFRLNGSDLEVSDNGNPYETLVDHVNALSFRYYDISGNQITPPINTLTGRASIQKISIQITTQSVRNDMQSGRALNVTYSSNATPRNFVF